MKAIAAMSLNRVIGHEGRLPWHLPEDFAWFKRTTRGHVVLMGRKTFESLGKPLPDRVNLVVTRGGKLPGVTMLRDLAAFDPAVYAPKEVFVIGGAEIYAQLLDRCSDLYLSIVQREVEGDAFFPSFENRFDLVGVPLRVADFEVRHYRNRRTLAAALRA
ncbi:MAG: dihydrofolate reductase [Verrucomicrobiota bacterium]|nr:dihydrofolate reductase [Verrucomicrobiota bacterium]